jgi:predicted DsbA family dithiol-disulfide isomerase
MSRRNQTVYDINNLTDDIKRKMREYGITSVPTTIIDGNIKVVGIYPTSLGYVAMIYTGS